MDHPHSGKDGSEIDADLGDGHYLQWSTYKGEVVGGIITHQDPNSPTGRCAGAFWLRSNAFNRENPTASPRPEWDMTGTFDCPTLSPSFRCHCGDHGYIRSGKWERA